MGFPLHLFSGSRCRRTWRRTLHRTVQLTWEQAWFRTWPQPRWDTASNDACHCCIDSCHKLSSCDVHGWRCHRWTRRWGTQRAQGRPARQKHRRRRGSSRQKQLPWLSWRHLGAYAAPSSDLKLRRLSQWRRWYLWHRAWSQNRWDREPVFSEGKAGCLGCVHWHCLHHTRL